MFGGKFETVGAVTFDGATVLTRGADLSAIANAKSFTLVYWVNSAGALGIHIANDDSGTNKFQSSQSATRNMQVTGRNAAGALILDARSSFSDGWNCLLISIDLNNAANRQIYIGDTTGAPTFPTYTNDTIDFQGTNWAIGAFVAGASKYSGQMASLWLKLGTFVDFSNVTNRRLFVSAVGRPVDLGATGTNPGLGTPEVFLNIAPFATPSGFATNAGSGGNFSATTGALTAASSNP